MKKHNLILSGMALILLASCSQDEILAPGLSGDGNTTLTVTVPKSFKTKADLGDGLTATVLNYAIYDAESVTGTSNFVGQGVAYFQPTTNSTTVNLNLAKGKTYNIAFFAQSAASQNTATGGTSNGVYDFDGEAGTVTVNYGNMTSAANLADAYDCFYKYETGIVAGSTTNVVLKRPVAQINWGTNDEATVTHEDAYGANGKYIQTTLEAQAYTTLTLSTGAVSGETAVKLENFAAPWTQTFPVAAPEGADFTYGYVSVSYLLVPSDENTVQELSLSINNGLNPNTTVSTLENVIDVANAPVQGNFRTNIFGALLTSSNTFTVTKDANWGDPSYDLPPSEALVPGLYFDSETKTYTITSTNGLEYYSTEIAGTSSKNNGMNGYTVVLGADLDMTGVTHTPITNNDATFDGRNHTISNLTVTQTNGAYAGFFANGTGIIKNINFTNVNITGTFTAGIVAEGVAANLENINVNGIKVISTPWKNGSAFDDGNNVGALVGYLSAEGSASVKDCTVTGATVIGFRKVGGLIGYVNGTNATISGNTISDSNVVADLVTNAYGDYTATSANIVGKVASNSTSGEGTDYITGNTVTNVNVSIVTAGTNGEIQLNSGTMADFAYFANVISKNPGNFSRKTIQFAKDATYDFTGSTLSNIGFWNSEGTITIDGNNCTITNLTLGSGTASYSGCLFGSLTANFQNFNIDGMEGSTGGRFAGFIGNLYGNVDNVKAKNVNISSTEGRIGVIVGIHNGGNMTNCTLTDCSVTGDWSVGGLSGAINETANRTYSGNTLTNVTVTNPDSKFGSGYSVYYGLLTGDMAAKGMTFTDNVFNNCTVNGTANSQIAFNMPDFEFTWNGQSYPGGAQTWPK